MPDEIPGMVGAEIPVFHDGYLDAVALGADAVTLGLRDSRDNPYELRLSGLEALHIDGFREGNIILALQVITGQKPQSCGLDDDDVREVMDLLFPPPHPMAEPKYHEAHAEVIERQLARIEAGEATLVTIDPAYGADLVAYCTGVEFQGPP